MINLVCLVLAGFAAKAPALTVFLDDSFNEVLFCVGHDAKVPLLFSQKNQLLRNAITQHPLDG